MVNAEFYTDPELLRWPAAKRDLYRSMWAMAEDSACIEDDPFGWKCAAWPSPLDSKTHSVAKFTAWRAELIEAGKAVAYEAQGGHYLFLNMSILATRSRRTCLCPSGSPGSSTPLTCAKAHTCSTGCCTRLVQRSKPPT
jgi:hypothetical protein